MTDTVYTETVTAEIVGRYVDAVESGATYDERTALVAEIAEELEVNAVSVRGKLVAEKVYVAKTATKAGEKRGTRTKADVVKALEAVTGVSLTSFEKATKVDLEAMFNFIVTASDEFNADRGLTVPEVSE